MKEEVSTKKSVPVLDPKRDFVPPRRSPLQMLKDRFKRIFGTSTSPTVRH